MNEYIIANSRAKIEFCAVLKKLIMISQGGRFTPPATDGGDAEERHHRPPPATEDKENFPATPENRSNQLTLFPMHFPNLEFSECN